MSLLPVAQRELRVQSRRRTTHWSRFGLSLVAALITTSFFLRSTVGGAAMSQIGSVAFWSLASAAFVLACAGGALTADTISGERREGTLGLLFLTDLRSWDVVLSKLASAGLNAVYAGIGFVPMLMLPLLAGGVTGAEAVRVGITVLVTLMLSLAVGLAASAHTTSRFLALRNAAIGVLLTLVVPLLVVYGLHRSWPVSFVRLLSPIETFFSARDVVYRTAPFAFWTSFGVQWVLTALVLVLACVLLRRSLTDVQAPAPIQPPRASGPYSADPFSNASEAIVNPPVVRRSARFKDGPPIEWLVRRQRGQRAICWLAALLAVATNFLSVLFSTFVLRFPSVAVGASLVFGYAASSVSWLSLALLSWAACRFFFDARQSGELELLLTTPVGAQTAVSAHWAAMKRLLFGPVLLMAAPPAFSAVYYMLVSPGSLPAGVPFSLTLTSVLHIGAIVLQVAAVTWLGIYFGLTARRQITAVALASALAVGLPAISHSLLLMVLSLIPSLQGRTSVWLNPMLTLTYFLVDYALWLAMIGRARSRLRRGVREPSSSGLWADAKVAFRGMAAAVRAARHWTPS